MSATVNTSGWQYADWQEEATLSGRLSRLLKHITEVRQAAVEHGHGRGRVQRLDPKYLDGLREDEQTLRAVVAEQQMLSGGRNPTVARPQF